MAQSLKNILRNIDTICIEGSNDISIVDIQFDSRKVQKGSLFVAVKGTVSDGHKFISQVIENGACAIVCEELPANRAEGVCYIKVKSASEVLGKMASNYYDNPSQKLKLVGITGTNGKTTSVTLLYRLFSELGYACGLLSTICNYVGAKKVEATHTTPDQVQLNALLAEMVDAGCEYAFMEVSSHSVDQNRIAGLEFAGGIFSNLTRDHLDYHNTFQDYLNAKKGFFDGLSRNAFALTNSDDKNGRIMVQNCKANIKTYALKTMADYKCRILESHFDGMQLQMDGNELWARFIGDFNAYNLMTVYGAACELGANKEEILTVLSSMKAVDGRFEYLKSEDGKTAVVDYAHTPDALKNVLNTINDIRQGQGSLITVVGAGGDRDKGKRPLMAKVAAEQSEKVILTSDNPRTEDPEAILDDMQAELDTQLSRKMLRITNRKEAIRTAIMLAQPADIILVAGKGHETYQEINGVKHHFDDKEIIRELFDN